MATFEYGRVSTKDQQSENQRLELERAGYQVDYWFADEGISHKVPALQRHQFAKVLGQTRDRETLVVTKLDHLGNRWCYRLGYSVSRWHDADRKSSRR